MSIIRLGNNIRKDLEKYVFKKIQGSKADITGNRTEKFATTNVQLCMIEEREKILAQVEYLAENYEERYPKQTKRNQGKVIISQDFDQPYKREEKRLVEMIHVHAVLEKKYKQCGLRK